MTATALCDTIVRQAPLVSFVIPPLTWYDGVNDNIAPSQ